MLIAQCEAEIKKWKEIAKLQAEENTSNTTQDKSSSDIQKREDTTLDRVVLAMNYLFKRIKHRKKSV